MAEKRGEDKDSGTYNKLILKKAVDKRIRQIKEKAFITEREVYDLIRSFFKKYLRVDYEFTREEVLNELKLIYISSELKQKVSHLFHHIAKIEHTSKAFSREELEKVLDEFSSVVDDLVGAHYKKEKSFFKKLGHSIHNLFSRKHRKMLDIDESVLSENERVIVKMNMLLDNAKRWSNKDLAKAKEAYKELNELYESLDASRKEVYYKPIEELYSMITNKEKSRS